MAQKKEKPNAPVEKNDIAKIEELGEELKKLRMELAQKTFIKTDKKIPKKEKKVVAQVEAKIPTKKVEKKVAAKVAKKILAKEEKKKKEEPKSEEKKTYEEELEEQLTDEEIENFQIEKMDMEKLTNRVCDIVAKYESDGMLQSELWKKLKLTSRDGSRLALKLERQGIISREKILENGRWTYKLIIKKTPVSTESIEGAPCLTCPVEQKCSLEGEISPRTCQLIEDWVLIEITKKKSQ